MRKINIIIIFVFFLTSVFSLTCNGADMGMNQNPMASANSEFQQAEKDLQKAAEEFSKGASANPLQQNGQTSWSQASTQTPENNRQEQPSDVRSQPLQGSPETGYAGTWTDPANGDIVTTVIAPKAQPAQQYQNYPIFVEPQINGFGGYDNNPIITPGLNQWPTTPDNPGYPIQNPPYNQPPAPGWHPYYPGQPYPGFNPYPYPFPQPYPGYNQPTGIMPTPPLTPGIPGSTPPPFDPNYRPLRPTPGQQPGNPGSIWQPGMNPGGNWNSGTNNGIGWNPGNQPNFPSSNISPNPSQPSAPSLPLNPAGQSWHRSPFSPNSSGIGGGKTGRSLF